MVSRHPDTEANRRPNELLIKARGRLASPYHPGRRMSRAELADAVNVALDELYPDRNLSSYYVDGRWIGKLERGEHHWASPERRAALRKVLGAATDHELGLCKPRHVERGVSAPLLGEPATPIGDEPVPEIRLRSGALPTGQVPEQTRARHTEQVAGRRGSEPEAGKARSEAPQEEISGEISMQRRSVLRALGALAASSQPLVQWEGLRHGIAAALDPDLDRWDQVVADYGIAYYRLPADQIMATLRADLTVVQALIASATGATRDRLLQITARLSVIVAINMVTAGQTLVAARWWRDAQDYAGESGDADSIVLTRSWDVVNGCYDGRPTSETITIADSVLPLAEERATAASCGLLAGRAQALSLAGEHAEAIRTVQRLVDMVERLPNSVSGDASSLWGWPEHRLRHTEAWVYAHAGHLREATRAQEQALKLYPAIMSRLKTQVQLHHAAALIRGGHIPDGLRQAADLLDQLPESQHNELVRTVARQVIGAVPVKERGRPIYRELTERVAA